MGFKEVITEARKEYEDDEPQKKSKSDANNELIESLNLLVDRDNPMSAAAEEALDSL